MDGDPNRGVPENSPESGGPSAPATPDASSTEEAQLVVGRRPLRERRGFWPIVAGASVLVAVGIGLGIWAGIESSKITVPDLAGLSSADAESSLLSASLELGTVDGFTDERWIDFARVSAQTIAPNSRVFAGEAVGFTLEAMRVEVPNIVGQSLATAASDLATRGIAWEATEEVLVDSSFVVDSDEFASFLIRRGFTATVDPHRLRAGPDAQTLNRDEWEVAEQSVRPGAQLLAGETVQLTPWLPVRTVPQVVGLSQIEADSALHELSLRHAIEGVVYPADPAAIETFTRPDDTDGWLIAAQQPASGTVVLPKSEVTTTLEWPSVEIPWLGGMTPNDATSTIEGLGLVASGTGSGLVNNQNPGPSRVPIGATVIFTAVHTVTFQVESSSGSGMVTWAPPGSFNIAQTETSLPWSISWERGSAPGRYERGNFNAQMDSWDGWITCRIIVDGIVVSESTSNGAFAVTSCS